MFQNFLKPEVCVASSMDVAWMVCGLGSQILLHVFHRL